MAPLSRLAAVQNDDQECADGDGFDADADHAGFLVLQKQVPGQAAEGEDADEKRNAGRRAGVAALVGGAGDHVNDERQKEQSDHEADGKHNILDIGAGGLERKLAAAGGVAGDAAGGGRDLEMVLVLAALLGAEVPGDVFSGGGIARRGERLEFFRANRCIHDHLRGLRLIAFRLRISEVEHIGMARHDGSRKTAGRGQRRRRSKGAEAKRQQHERQ